MKLKLQILLAAMIVFAVCNAATLANPAFSVVNNNLTVTNYSYTGAVVTQTITQEGFYRINARGAQGGGNFLNLGGFGATANGTFFLPAGTVLQIAVGGVGGNGNGGGGGGGSFVYIDTSTPLVAAGGGGGATLAYNGGNGRAVTGGVNGLGGSGSVGAGGAGFFGDGGNGIFGATGGRKAPVFSGGTSNSGDGNGGFGGGGAGGTLTGNSGGGGGGYSGGGGGGSFVAATFAGVGVQSATTADGTGANTGNGSVSVEFLPLTAAAVSISGRVLTSANQGLMNAVVNLTDSAGNAHSARTNAFGYYRFEDIPAGQTVIITIVSKRYQFTPRVLTVNEEVADLDFVALAPLREN